MMYKTIKERAVERGGKVSHEWFENAMKRFKQLSDEVREKYNQFIGFNDFSDTLLNEVTNAYEAGATTQNSIAIDSAVRAVRKFIFDNVQCNGDGTHLYFKHENEKALCDAFEDAIRKGSEA